MKAWLLWKEETARDIPGEGCSACEFLEAHGGNIDAGVGWVKDDTGKVIRIRTFPMGGVTVMHCHTVTEDEAREEYDAMVKSGWVMNIATPANGPQS